MPNLPIQRSLTERSVFLQRGRRKGRICL